MVTKKNITEIFELILKTYDDEEKCKKEYETFNYTTMKGENVTIEVEELHQIPNFQEAGDGKFCTILCKHSKRCC